MRRKDDRTVETYVLAAIGPERAALSDYHDRLNLYVNDADARAALDRLIRQGAVVRDERGGLRRDLQKWIEKGTNR